MSSRILSTAALLVCLFSAPITSAAAPLCDGKAATEGCKLNGAVHSCLVINPAARDRINGTNGDDVIIVVSSNDVMIRAFGGDDTICSGSANDKIRSGRGDDYVDGGGGNDSILTGYGDDETLCSSGMDSVDAGKGVDACSVACESGTGCDQDAGDGCTLDLDCPAGESCRASTHECTTMDGPCGADADCVPGQLCVAGTCGENPVCGNGLVESGEKCESTVPLADSCVSLFLPAGVLSCDAGSCQYDTSRCTLVLTCGSDAECASGFYCNAGACIQPNGDCTADANCVNGQVCTDGTCANPSFEVTLPDARAAFTPFSVTVTAVDVNGNTLPSYRGTIAFTSSDDTAILPADYTFTPGDAGSHTFTLGATLKIADPIQFVVVNDTAVPALAGASSIEVVQDVSLYAQTDTLTLSLVTDWGGDEGRGDVQLITGAVLEIFDYGSTPTYPISGSAGVERFYLPASGWSSDGSGGFTYQAVPAPGSCSLVRILNYNKVVAECEYQSLTLPFEGALGIVLVSGAEWQTPPLYTATDFRWCPTIDASRFFANTSNLLIATPEPVNGSVCFQARDRELHLQDPIAAPRYADQWVFDPVRGDSWDPHGPRPEIIDSAPCDTTFYDMCGLGTEGDPDTVFGFGVWGGYGEQLYWGLIWRTQPNCGNYDPLFQSDPDFYQSCIPFGPLTMSYWTTDGLHIAVAKETVIFDDEAAPDAPTAIAIDQAIADLKATYPNPAEDFLLPLDTTLYVTATGGDPNTGVTTLVIEGALISVPLSLDSPTFVLPADTSDCFTLPETGSLLMCPPAADEPPTTVVISGSVSDATKFAQITVVPPPVSSNNDKDVSYGGTLFGAQTYAP